ncbi:MAG: twin-arginine translocase TatA/TatE family subunit [Spirochaetaceae bacterium]|nr:MAG: twin-arginine translocase TatA/TatE family subunit [Spirochaetaceae bacterium]
MFGRIGPMELILIFAIALIIFGPKKLPEIGKAVGSAIRNFKRHSNSITEELDLDDTADQKKDSDNRTGSDST